MGTGCKRWQNSLQGRLVDCSQDYDGNNRKPLDLMLRGRIVGTNTGYRIGNLVLEGEWHLSPVARGARVR